MKRNSGRPCIFGRAMSNTERTQRHHARLKDEAARASEIERRYFSGTPQLSPREQRQFARHHHPGLFRREIKMGGLLSRRLNRLAGSTEPTLVVHQFTV